MSDIYDLLIIGGGINGVGIARDAAGRGLKVALVEKGDLASATSSASTKLIHGGLRYLEHYEFRLVRESLMERETLLKVAPHIIWPLRFTLPHHKALRPGWLLRLGLFLYDHLGGRKILPPTKSLDLSRDPEGGPLKDMFKKGFAYSDCWVDDARLVVLNAMDARERGATIMTRTKCVSAKRGGDHWTAVLEEKGGAIREVRARGIVNAAGPWVSDMLDSFEMKRKKKRAAMRLVKGSHAIARKLYDGDQAYIFQNGDGRIVFAIPYEQDFTLLGTTDVVYDGEPGDAAASADEVAYICSAVSEYLKTPVTPDDIIHTYSGVRPLYDDKSDNKASAVTRDYVFDINAIDGRPVVLSIFGGKITTYRKLAEHALNDLLPYLKRQGDSWTKTAPLPGGTIENAAFDAFFDGLAARYPWFDRKHLWRIARAYGSRVFDILGEATSLEDLGWHYGYGLTERELEYLRDQEWAETADDVLWRRSKLGLHLNQVQIDAVHQWFTEKA